jgi:hypothetical protein
MAGACTLIQNPLGAPCTTSSSCQSGACVPSAMGGGSICCAMSCTASSPSSCGTDGLCATNGGSCALYPGGTACGGAGLTCNGSGSCVGAPGAVCSSNASCTSGVCGVNGTGNCCGLVCNTGGVCGATACNSQGGCVYPSGNSCGAFETCNGSGSCVL